MTDILDTAREELAKGNGADSCPICYSIIRALVAEVERMRGECATFERDYNAQVVERFAENSVAGHTIDRLECDLAALRQRHAEAVELFDLVLTDTVGGDITTLPQDSDGRFLPALILRKMAAWLASEAKKGLESDRGK